MQESFDIIIIGGGIVGLSAAIAMRQRGYTVAIIDAGPLSTIDTTNTDRVYAINKASESLLKTLGVWEKINAAQISPYQKMHIWDKANSAHIDFDARLIGAEKLGTIIPALAIIEALLQVARTQKIHLIANNTVTSLTEVSNGVDIQTDNANKLHAQLLIIADGAKSAARAMLKVPLTSWSYKQHAIVATVQTELPHLKTAYQVFHPHGPLAFLPLKTASHCSIVWSTTPTHAATLMALSDEIFNQQLTDAFAQRLGLCQLVSKRQQFPLIMRHAKRYCGPRWLLMGDAAHTIHPLAGLGLNLGLGDVLAWLGIFDAHPILSSTKILQTYQRQRKYAVWQVIALMEALKTLFASTAAPICVLRGLGLQISDQIPLIKRLFIQQASEV